MLTAEENEYLTRTGPGTPMGNLYRRFWLPVLLPEELPAPDCPPVRVRLLGEDLVAFRDTDGRIGLLDARCPHRLADLFFGRNEECGLRCVYHGWKFDVAGTCVDMPNEPAESNFKHKVRTTAYPCREWGGLIWAYLGPKEKMPAELPQAEWALVPDSHRYWGKVLVECNYLAPMEGEVDNSHVGFLHRALTGGQQSSQVRLNQSRHSMFHYAPKDRAPRGFVKETPYGMIVGWRREADAGHYHWHIQQWMLPYGTVVRQVIGMSQLVLLRVPRDDESNWWFIAHWNSERPLTASELATYRAGLGFIPELIPGSFRPTANKDNDYLIDRALQKSYNFTGIPGSIALQDIAAAESQGVIMDRTKEHLGTSDVAIIALRRLLLKVAKELEQGIEPYAATHPEVYYARATDGLLPRDVPFDENLLLEVVMGEVVAGRESSR